MGGIFSAPEPTYEVLHKATNSQSKYEIRLYPNIFIAECMDNKNDDCFNQLAEYIGVFGKP